MSLPILYQDASLVVIHKPSGLLVHRSQLDRHETRFAVQLLRDQIGQPVYPVHRLDKGTSGVLVFALAREALAVLGQAFAEGRVEKRYLAVVRGIPAQEGCIDHPLTRRFDPAEHRSLAAQSAAPQEARTRYRTLATVELPVQVDRYPSSRYALVELFPETGRRHQLRRHLKHIAHPIIGDATYGKGRHNRLFQTLFGSHRLLLACTELAFTHPLSGVTLRIDARPATDFMDVVHALGWNTDYSGR